MRKLFYGAAAAVCLGAAGPAMANGSMKDVVVVEPAPIWSGCYFGLNVGGASNGDNDIKNVKKSEHHYHYKDDAYKDYEEYKTKGKDAYHGEYGHYYWRDTKHYSFDDDDVSPFGGGHVGCNWESANFVYGIESDIGFGDDIDYLATIRGRLGAAWDRSMIYVTGGVAFAQFDKSFRFRHKHKEDDWSSDSYRGPGPHGDYTVNRYFDNENDETGWVLGLGWEYLIKQNMSFGLEGLYYSFDDDSGKHKFVDGIYDCEGCDGKGYYHKYKFDRDTDQDLFVIRARLSYHLRRAPEPLK
jgi:opacity protein-like surface antigen